MLTLITVNFNNARATIALLRSLEQQTNQEFDVIVIDNDSTHEDRGLLGQYASASTLKLDVIYSDQNRGFSGGNNIGVRKALAQGSEWLLFINNDTTVSEDFISTLRPHLTHEPALIGLPLGEGSRTAYAGEVVWNVATLPHRYIPVAGDSSSLYAIGAGMAVHRDVFDQVGLMDERFFLYFEDAEFSLRTRAAGIPVRFLEYPVITHTVSESTRHLGSPLLLRYHARNALLMQSIWGPWWLKVALPFRSFFGILKQLVKVALMPSRRPASRAIAAGIIDFYARRFGKITTTY
jgi:hypothetical protein